MVSRIRSQAHNGSLLRLNPKKSVGDLIHCNQVQKWELLGSWSFPRHIDREIDRSLVGQKEQPTLLVTPLVKEKGNRVGMLQETQ
jgi:hypothetical protein